MSVGFSAVGVNVRASSTAARACCALLPSLTSRSMSNCSTAGSLNRNASRTRKRFLSIWMNPTFPCGSSTSKPDAGHARARASTPPPSSRERCRGGITMTANMTARVGGEAGNTEHAEVGSRRRRCTFSAAPTNARHDVLVLRHDPIDDRRLLLSLVVVLLELDHVGPALVRSCRRASRTPRPSPPASARRRRTAPRGSSRPSRRRPPRPCG